MNSKSKKRLMCDMIMICMILFLFGCGTADKAPSPEAGQTDVQTDAAGTDDGSTKEQAVEVDVTEESTSEGADAADVTTQAKEDAVSAGADTDAKADTDISADKDKSAEETMQSVEEQTGAEEEPAEEEDEQTRIKNQYRDILLQYKEIQDARLGQDEVEQSGLTTELVQHGWPFACTTDEVKYLFYDIDDNGISELFITYYGDIVDIYAYDGEKVRYVFGCPYRGISELYPGGMLSLAFSYSANKWYTKWYEYDTGFGDFFPSFEALCDDGKNTVYFEYGSIDDGREEVEKAYKQMGEYPVWVYEWVCEDTKEEYENLVPKEPAIKLPEGKKLADANNDEDLFDR